jgi:hypothetical protein
MPSIGKRFLGVEMGKKKNVKNEDAKDCPYPCRTCDIEHPDRCSDKNCQQWQRWVKVRWDEVTAPLKRREQA